jgi:hypothetical protein
MKKVLLTFVICLPFLVQAQNQLKITTPQAPHSKMKGVPAYHTSIDQVVKHTATKSTSLSQRTVAYNPIGTVIGTTTYDLQTNASVARRILKYSGGQVSVVWNFSDGNSPWSDRGSAYVNFDGTVWGPQPNSRIETNRAGWPTICSNAANQEIIASHDPAIGQYNLKFNTNQGIGNTSWTQTTPLSSKGAIWPRASSVGDNIYIINNHNDTGFVEPLNGLKQPMYFSRSTDGGISFVDDHISLPGYDSTRYVRGEGDIYAIDSKDNYVVVGLVGLTNDVAYWKSNDYGVTFTKVIAFPFPIVPYFHQMTDINNDGIADTIDTNDGSCDVLLDSNGNVHMWYGYNRVFNIGSPDSTIFFPASNAIVYYNEQYDSLQVIASVVDCDNDQIISFGNGTLGGAQYNNSCLASMPMGMEDSSGNIFCIYSGIREGADSTANGQNFRDIMVTMSDDGGLTWIAEQNLTNDAMTTNLFGSEEVFTSINRYSDDGYMHVTFMADPEPGTEIYNGDDPGISEIRYVKFDLSSIIAGSFGPCGDATVGINNVVSTNNTSINAYPNPSSGSVSFNFDLNANSSAKITISNALGQSVMTIANGTFAAGSHTVNANLSTLEAGVYFYTFTTENSVITRKLVVTK